MTKNENTTSWPFDQPPAPTLSWRPEGYYDVELDELNIGTPRYRGAAYFWAYKYRFWMRGDAHGNGYMGIPIREARRRIHRRFMREGLPLAGKTARHDEIINKVFGMTDYTPDDCGS